MVLEIEDTIKLSTRFGTSEVQLLLGDITDLSVDEKVDIVFTSAFPGDYGSGIKTTLFYSLQKNLGINVRHLSKSKDLDLRENFSCWLSKPLPPEKPFRRLACFEVLRNQNLYAQISMMFRAIMPIFNGRESSIITPPLATGCQGADIDGMVNLMVNTACHWIKAGLPLTCMKLVLFTHDLEKARNHEYVKTIKLFKGLKKAWQTEEKAGKMRNYDVTLCYHLQDFNIVKNLEATFLKEDKELRIHSNDFKMKEDTSWQDEVFQVMANSRRIVIILTPSFVSDSWCLEQFSLGLCCNRLKGDEVVIPFYMVTVTTFPSYMNLVQYKECRVRHEGETAERQMLEACTEVIKSAKECDVVSKVRSESADLLEKGKPAPVYDIFVSYSHKNSEIAHITVEMLKNMHPELNVFLDRRELKSGNIWQQALYEAVDDTHSMIAFLSDAYVQSTVCQEEYNIALGRLKAKDDFLLIPVWLPELTSLTISNAPISPVKASTAEEIKILIDKIMPSVKKIISGKNEKQEPELDVKSIRNVRIKQRFIDFNKKYKFDEGTKSVVYLNDESRVENTIEGTVVFAYGSDGMKLAASLSQTLTEQFPKIQGNLLSFNQTEARKQIDCADVVVIFVSDEFLWSQHHVEELHIALCRQRTVKESTVVYLAQLEHRSPKPFYLNLLPFNVCFDDPIWKRFGKRLEGDIQRYYVKTRGMEGSYMCSNAEHLTLMQMKMDIVELLSQRGKGTSMPINLININRTIINNKGKEDENVSVSEMSSLESFTPNVLMKRSVSLTEDDPTLANEDPSLVQEEDLSTAERAEKTKRDRPTNPADDALNEMKEFFITKSQDNKLVISSIYEKKKLNKAALLKIQTEGKSALTEINAGNAATAGADIETSNVNENKIVELSDTGYDCGTVEAKECENRDTEDELDESERKAELEILGEDMNQSTLNMQYRENAKKQVEDEEKLRQFMAKYDSKQRSKSCILL